MTLKVDFRDVGQGDCSVIHLPDGRLLLIDVGPPESMLPEWLNARSGLDIHSLVLTHNDADHAGCAFDILHRHHAHIGRFVFVDDRRIAQSAATDELLAYGVRLHRQGKVRMVRLEAGEQPQSLYRFDDGQTPGVHLYALYPDAAETAANLHARRTNQPNEVSGILCLDVNGQTEVIWAGDASMQTVSRVAGDRNPLVIVGPHHGGPIKRKQASFAAAFDGPNPRNVFVSVGTGNIHGHPVPKFIEFHRDRFRRVCCSQLVHCDRRRVQSGRHVLNNHLSLGMLPPRSAEAVTCRGPMQITWNDSQKAFEFDRFHDVHHKLLEGIHKPLCLSASSPDPGGQALPLGFVRG